METNIFVIIADLILLKGGEHMSRTTTLVKLVYCAELNDYIVSIIYNYSAHPNKPKTQLIKRFDCHTYYYSHIERSCAFYQWPSTLINIITNIDKFEVVE